uniref:Transmembrane protein R6 n=1 Tax=Toxoplasma gondii TaxID=5811 RepID=Q86PT8_TOXGO|nr:transmembrane protein R6 [Toxoplasma gondii]
MLPNTMDCTFTAVPTRPVIWLMLLYFFALGLSHELNTARTANSSCFLGSEGMALP